MKTSVPRRLNILCRYSARFEQSLLQLYVRCGILLNVENTYITAKKCFFAKRRGVGTLN